MNIAAFSGEGQLGQKADGAAALRAFRPMIMGRAHKEGKTENRYAKYCDSFPHHLPSPSIDGRRIDAGIISKLEADCN